MCISLEWVIFCDSLALMTFQNPRILFSCPAPPSPPELSHMSCFLGCHMTHRSFACRSGRRCCFFFFPLGPSWLEYNKLASSSLWSWMTWECYFLPSSEEDKTCLSELSAEEVRLALHPELWGMWAAAYCNKLCKWRTVFLSRIK